MRHLYFLLLVLFVGSSCKSQNESANLNSKFDFFIAQFKTINLPYIIENEKQFPYYMKYDESTTLHYRDSIYKYIDSTELQFLFDDKISLSNIKYRYGNLIYKNTESLGIIYFRDSLDYEGNLDNVWIIMNTYKLTGELIDKITLAGYFFDVSSQFCSIDQDLIISINNLTFLPDDSNINAIKAIQKQINGKIRNNGIITKNQEKDTIKYFSIDNNGNYIEYRKE